MFCGTHNILQNIPHIMFALILHFLCLVLLKEIHGSIKRNYNSQKSTRSHHLTKMSTLPSGFVTLQDKINTILLVEIAVNTCEPTIGINTLF